MIDQYKRSGKKSCCEYHIISIYIKNKILLRKRNGGHKWVNDCIPSSSLENCALMIVYHPVA